MRTGSVLALALLLGGCTGGQLLAVHSTVPPPSTPKAPGSTSRLPAPLLTVSVVTGATCGAPCDGDLTVVADPSGPAQIHLTLYNYVSPAFQKAVAAQFDGELTPSGRQAAANLLRRMAQTSFQDRYPGCGQACDGYTVTVSMPSASGTRRVIYAEVPGRPSVIEGSDQVPTILKDLDAFLWDAANNLRACRTTSDLVPRGPCQPV